MTSARKELEAAAEAVLRMVWLSVQDRRRVADMLTNRASRLPASTWSVEQEREACAAAICILCKEGAPLTDKFMHKVDKRGEVSANPTSFAGCDAEDIWRSRTTPTATTEKEIGE